MKRHIVFSDVDGTLLTSDYRISGLTKSAIARLEEMGIPFVITSARSPSGIYPILRENGFEGPIISYSGGLILDRQRNILHDVGMPKARAGKILRFMREQSFDLSWCIYSRDEWLVESKGDPRIRQEERNVKAEAKQGTIDSLPEGAQVNKILCICGPGRILEIEKKMRAAFPDCSIVKSSDVLLEIMERGVTKGRAVQRLCALWGYDINDAVAFGDNYNDADMLECVGHGYLMGNAPSPLKERFSRVTQDNNHDGIYYALAEMGLIEK